MTTSDLDGVEAVATQVHPDFPEDREIFEERLRLHPAGCLVLERDGDIHGYVFSHPWFSSHIPKLNRLLGELPPEPETYYLHDIALLASARGQGAARYVVDMIVQHATTLGLHSISLCSVNRSMPFWESVGFSTQGHAIGVKAPKSYGSDAEFMCRDL